MREVYICVNVGTREVYCVGNKAECSKYLKQLETIDEECLDFIKLNEVQCLIYEGYELIYLRDVDLMLTHGEVQMLKNTCIEEQSSLRLVDEELNRLQESEIFSEEIKNQIALFMDTIDKMKIEQAKHLNENILYNIDVDALRYAYNMERENKGEPIIF